MFMARRRCPFEREFEIENDVALNLEEPDEIG
jgi:hypothetical protein